MDEIQRKEENAITPMQSPIMALAEKLAEGKMDAEQMEKMLDVQMKWESNEARKAYNEAISAFKANAPKIIKNRLVEFKQTKYKHATLDSIMDEIEKPLSEHGLNVSWKTDTLDNGAIKVTCRVTHELGHYEETSLPAMPDTSGCKNAIQAIGSTVTYLQRYTLKSALGLVEADQDDDGAGADKPIIPEPNPAQLAFIEKTCSLLPKKDGLLPNFDRIKTLLYMAKNKYPDNQEHAGRAAEYLVGKFGDEEIYYKDTRSQFEQDYDIE